MEMKRPGIFTITGFLLILSTILLWVIVLLSINEEGPGLAIVVGLGLSLSVLGMIAAAGLLVVKRWGLWLTGVVSALAIFYTVGGAVVSDPSLEKVLCIVLAALYALVIMLTVLSLARPSYRTDPALSGEGAN